MLICIMIFSIFSPDRKGVSKMSPTELARIRQMLKTVTHLSSELQKGYSNYNKEGVDKKLEALIHLTHYVRKTVNRFDNQQDELDKMHTLVVETATVLEELSCIYREMIDKGLSQSTRALLMKAGLIGNN